MAATSGPGSGVRPAVAADDVKDAAGQRIIDFRDVGVLLAKNIEGAKGGAGRLIGGGAGRSATGFLWRGGAAGCRACGGGSVGPGDLAEVLQFRIRFRGRGRQGCGRHGGGRLDFRWRRAIINVKGHVQDAVLTKINLPQALCQQVLVVVLNVQRPVVISVVRRASDGFTVVLVGLDR